MAVKIKEIIALVEKLAPLDGMCNWDNVGLIIGNGEADTAKVFITLDVTDEVVLEAINKKVRLIITHHPVIFSGIKEINTSTSLGKRLLALIKNDISVYSAHTNLDVAVGGTNDIFFDLLGLKEKGMLEVEFTALGRTGICDKGFSLKDYANFLRKKLFVSYLKYAGDPDKIMKKIGFATGSASGIKYFTEAAKASCDLYITGDISYHEAQAALDMGLNIIDAGHFPTEIIVVSALCRYLKAAAIENNWDIEIEAAIQRDIFYM